MAEVIFPTKNHLIKPISIASEDDIDDRILPAHAQPNPSIISPRSQWEEYICPECDKLMDDAVQTSCGHQMCYKCFDMRWSRGDPWCPVRGDDGQEHKMSQDNWRWDNVTERKINKLLVKCDECEVECTVKRYRKFDCSTAHQAAGFNSLLISPRSQLEEYICPECDELMDDPVKTSCGHQMCYKCFKWNISIGGDSWCPVRGDDGQEHKMSRYDWKWDSVTERKINKLLLKCDKCEVECTVKRYRKFDCSTAHQGLNSLLVSPRSHWQEYICPECDELMDDPVQTSCGHRMCYKCFDKRRRNRGDPWCPVRSGDGQEHKMSQENWYELRGTVKRIKELLVKCGKCKIECTVREYGKFHFVSKLTQEDYIGAYCYLLTDHKEDHPHWKQLLLQDETIRSSELCSVSDKDFFSKFLSTMGCKGLTIFQECIGHCQCHSCMCLSADLLYLSDHTHSSFKSTATADSYTELASKKTFRELEKLPPSQQQELITQVLKETLPAARDDLFIDDIRPLLYQNGVITDEEATELLGIFSGEEKVRRLYTKMLPKKGAEGLKEFMRILYDTGWDTPSHMRHHGVLLINLSEKLTQIKSAESVLHHYESEKAAKEAIVPMVYSESLPDAVINLSMGINKLLLPMLKKRLVNTMEYFWLRQIFCPGEKIKELYEVILPQKGVKGLKAFMEVLQDIGRKIPKYQNHQDLLKSRLQACLFKV